MYIHHPLNIAKTCSMSATILVDSTNVTKNQLYILSMELEMVEFPRKAMVRTESAV